MVLKQSSQSGRVDSILGELWKFHRIKIMRTESRIGNSGKVGWGGHLSRLQGPGGDACPLKMVVVIPCGRF